MQNLCSKLAKEKDRASATVNLIAIFKAWTGTRFLSSLFLKKSQIRTKSSEGEGVALGAIKAQKIPLNVKFVWTMDLRDEKKKVSATASNGEVIDVNG